MLHKSVICCLLAAAVAVSEGRAQEFGRVGDIETRGTSYYVFARPGDATVQVLVMGLGGGIYEISNGTRLDELLALVGGASDTNIGQRTERQVRTTTVRLYRMQGPQRVLIYEAPLQEMLLEPGTYPTLQDEDLFIVETLDETRFDWRDGLRIVTSAASVLLLIERIVRRF